MSRKGGKNLQNWSTILYHEGGSEHSTLTVKVGYGITQEIMVFRYRSWRLQIWDTAMQGQIGRAHV